MTNNPALETSPVQNLDFRALKLRAGLALQVQKAGNGAKHEEAQFLGAVDGKGIMVGPYHSGDSIALACDHQYSVRGFTGQHDFSFEARVLQTFEKPFVYALLEYPQKVSAHLVRRALRMKTSHPAKAWPTNQTRPIDVTMIDVSHCGAMVHSPVPLGTFGEVIDLALSIEFDGAPVKLNVPSTICHSRRSDHDGGTHVGLSFKPNTKDDKLMLYFLAQSSAEG